MKCVCVRYRKKEAGESQANEGHSVNKLIRWKISSLRWILISIQQSPFQQDKMLRSSWKKSHPRGPSFEL